jgi:DNA-binding beta-propeller fold protein YncE
LDLNSGATIAVIPTGTGAGTKTPGIRRADELCYNPQSDVVLVANDDPLDNFITFIDEDSYKVIQRIRFDGTDPNGDNILANGIEQCAFNPRDGKFYLNIPNTGAASLKTPLPGVTVRISGKAPFKVEKVIADFSKAPLNTTGCTGSTGLAVGPDGQLGLSCGLIINDNGAIVANFPSEGGADELWYNPGNNHYFLADTGATKLGVIDAGPPPSADLTAATAPGSHSVAVDPRRNQVYVPIRGNTGQAPGPLGTLCSKGKDVFGHAGSDALGCIAIYTAPRDADDHRAEADEDDDR